MFGSASGETSGRSQRQCLIIDGSAALLSLVFALYVGAFIVRFDSIIER